jgi:hypothetical protein
LYICLSVKPCSNLKEELGPYAGVEAKLVRARLLVPQHVEKVTFAVWNHTKKDKKVTVSINEKRLKKLD